MIKPRGQLGKANGFPTLALKAGADCQAAAFVQTEATGSVNAQSIGKTKS